MVKAKAKGKGKGKEKVEIDWASLRKYPVRGEQYVSVTTLLSKTESLASQHKLESWGRDWETDPANQGKLKPHERGSYIDSVVNQYLTPPPADRVLPSATYLDDQLKPFMLSLTAEIKGQGKCALEMIEECVWVQGLLDPDLVPHGRRLFKPIEYREPQEFIASYKYKFGGVPDVVGVFDGKLTLISLKTSDKLYYRTAPRWEEVTARKKEGLPPTAQWSMQYGGNKKYEKTLIQESMYKMALEETLGIHVQQILVLVSTPTKPQIFIVKEWEMEQGMEKAMKRISKWNELLASQELAAELVSNLATV